jgi:hypothetical protein
MHPVVRISLLLLLVALSVGQANDIPESCPGYFSYLAPRLSPEIPEGDWKEFLDKKFVLADGTKVPYRDFDRLGPNFWAQHREDWEPVSRQIFEDLTSELDGRGVPWSRVWTHEGAPLNRYTLVVGGNDVKAGMEVSPSRQMGIIPRAHFIEMLGGGNQRAVSHLPLSWLGMKECHGCEYHSFQDKVAAANDDLVLMKAYIGGNTGTNTIAGVQVSGGDFQNSWSERQSRRGERAFRVAREGDASKSLPDVELGLAEQIKKTAQTLREKPESASTHRALAEKLGKYMLSTGIPVALVKSPDGKSFDIRVLPMTSEQWSAVMAKYTTSLGGKPEVAGHDQLPELIRIAASAANQGFDVVFNTRSFLNMSSGVDINNSRVVLFPTGIFSREPLEGYLMQKDLADLLPQTATRIVAAFKLPDEESGNFALGEIALHSAQLMEEIKQLQTMRTSLSPEQYALAMNQKLVLLQHHSNATSSTHEALAVALNAPRPLQEGDIHLLKRKGNTLAVALRMPPGNQVTYLMLDMPTKGIEKSDIKQQILRLLANEREGLVVGKKEISHVNKFLSDNHEALAVRNELSDDELVAFINQEKTAVAARGSLLRSSPTQYFKHGIKDLKYWSTVDEKVRKQFQAQAAEKMAADPQELKSFLSASLPYLLQKESSYDKHDGANGDVVTDVFGLLEKAVKSPGEKTELIVFAKKLASESHNDATRMYAIGLLGETGMADAETKKIIQNAIALNAGGTSNWAAFAAAKLFPKDLDHLLVPSIVSSDSSLRTSILGTLNGAKHYSEPALLAAVEATDLPTNGSPGTSGYIRDSHTRNPKVIAAIKAGLSKNLAEGKPIHNYLSMIEALDIRDPQTFAALTRHANSLSTDSHSSQLANVLYKIDQHAPYARRAYEARVQEGIDRGEAWHAWSYLETLQKLATIDPAHPLLKPGVAALEKALKSAQVLGFDSEGFAKLKRDLEISPE